MVPLAIWFIIWSLKNIIIILLFALHNEEDGKTAHDFKPMTSSLRYPEPSWLFLLNTIMIIISIMIIVIVIIIIIILW